MLSNLKKILYFPIAYYFRLFAQIQLDNWKPRIIVITGSSGKTTCLSLIESQLQSKAKYSHKANSAFGIPFDILGLKRINLQLKEWPILFLLAPIRAFKRPPKEKLYIVEADCDRPNEGKFLATLLKPEVTLWLNVSMSHSINFDKLVRNKEFPSVDEAIASEFGYFIEHTTKLSIVNGDSTLILSQTGRTKSKVERINKNSLQKYAVFVDHTEFKIGDQNYSLKNPIPEDAFYAIEMCMKLLSYLGAKSDKSFSKLSVPPGRSSALQGFRHTTLFDSTYNATLGSMRAILNMFGKIQSNKKWIVIGDMIEQGEEERQEHEKLADIILLHKYEQIVLIGPRVSKYTYPKLKQSLKEKTEIKKFLFPKEVLDYLKDNIKGDEVILFKGARFLEGVIAGLLKNKNDILKLPRREKVWEARRNQWGL